MSRLLHIFQRHCGTPSLRILLEHTRLQNEVKGQPFEVLKGPQATDKTEFRLSLHPDDYDVIIRE